MNQEVLFAQALEQVRKLAAEQGNCVSEEQVKGAFAGQNLEEAQFALVYDYLKQKKIGIGEPVNPEDYLTGEEADYLKMYLEELETLEMVTDGVKEAVTLSAMAGDADAKSRLVELYLKEVTEIAKLYAGQGVFLEDLIGEGNVALAMGVEMLELAENAAEAQGTLVSMIMEAMENFIAEETQAKESDEKAAEEVNRVMDAAKELAESIGRKVTAAELAEESGMEEESIRKALRFCGDQIDYLESGK